MVERGEQGGYREGPTIIGREGLHAFAVRLRLSKSVWHGLEDPQCKGGIDVACVRKSYRYWPFGLPW